MTGVNTTGHEWDGIRELDNPMPRWWVQTFYVSHRHRGRGDVDSLSRPGRGARAISAACCAPTSGWISSSGMARRRRRRPSGWTGSPLPMRPRSRPIPSCGSSRWRAARSAFKTNCAPCHGARRRRPGLLPDPGRRRLALGRRRSSRSNTRSGTASGTAQDADARDNAMPAFGADGLLEPAQIANVTQYVLSLTGRQTDEAAAVEGAAIFAENCAACHGEEGGGLRRTGRPGAQRRDLAVRRRGRADHGADQPPAARRDAPLAGPARRRHDQDAGGLRACPGRRPVALPGNAPLPAPSRQRL